MFVLPTEILTWAQGIPNTEVLTIQAQCLVVYTELFGARIKCSV
jgi:hypothetical protein